MRKLALRIIAILVVAISLTACGNSELDNARTEINNLSAKNVTLTNSNATLRDDLSKEIQAKKEHAIAEEKFKNLHRQAVADLGTALDKLRACQGHKANPKKRK